MVLRLIAENLTSFKEAVEFNTFPSSKSHSHENHKITCGHATALRMSAIYGANGAGKSNLLQALNLLQTLVKTETLRKIDFYDDPTFKLDSQCSGKPSGLAVEFYNNNVFYYHVEFTLEEIVLEELLLSKKSKDIPLFTRKRTDISIDSNYIGKGISEQFQDALKRLVRPDMLLLSFLGKYYSSESPLVVDAYQWFMKNLQLVLPDMFHGFVPHMIDTDSEFSELVNRTLPELKTGIDKVIVKKELIAEEDVKSGKLIQLVKQAKEHPGEPQTTRNRFTDDVVNVIFENGNVYLKTLVAVHRNLDGSEVEMSLHDESDGTRRLIEYMPLLYAIIQKDMVYVVDEIERSIHPIMIKDIVRKLSESTTAKGQLIFTTHESGLLDQNIFRPDEIWFAQKDAEQATQLYPLSDFNIHKTANIENGYLNGRYGGIPFLSNLKDLHW